MANESMVEAPMKLGMILPTEGNVKHDPSKPEGSEVIPGTENYTEAEKLLLAERALKQKEEKARQDKLLEEQKNKEKQKAKEDKEVEEDSPTEEEIQAKLTELNAKKEEELTDKDKQFLEEYNQSEVDEITSAKQDIEGTYGIKLETKYENSPDGLKQLISDVAPKVAEQLFLDSLNRIPYMRDFYTHIVQEGKSIETFLSKNEKPAFESIEVKSLDGLDDNAKTNAINNLKALVTMDFKAKGLAEDDIVNFIQLYEANGTLYDKAKLAKENLSKEHKATVDAKLKEEEARIAQRDALIQQEYLNVKNIIEKNDFEGISIPTTDVKAFADAMLRPINGQEDTLMDLKRSKLTLANRALIDYIIFKDFKINGLTSKAPSKAFTFSKANRENISRKGGRVNGGSDSRQERNTENPSLDIKNVNFSELYKN